MDLGIKQENHGKLSVRCIEQTPLPTTIISLSLPNLSLSLPTLSLFCYLHIPFVQRYEGNCSPYL